MNYAKWVDDLQERLEDAGIVAEDLDDFVYDVTDQIASSINNQGMLEQIRWLLENGFTVDDIYTKLDLDKPKDLSDENGTDSCDLKS